MNVSHLSRRFLKTQIGQIAGVDIVALERENAELKAKVAQLEAELQKQYGRHLVSCDWPSPYFQCAVLNQVWECP